MMERLELVRELARVFVLVLVFVFLRARAFEFELALSRSVPAFVPAPEFAFPRLLARMFVQAFLWIFACFDFGFCLRKARAALVQILEGFVFFQARILAGLLPVALSGDWLWLGFLFLPR